MVFSFFTEHFNHTMLKSNPSALMGMTKRFVENGEETLYQNNELGYGFEIFQQFRTTKQLLYS